MPADIAIAHDCCGSCHCEPASTVALKAPRISFLTMVISSPDPKAVVDAKQNTGAKVAFHAIGSTRAVNIKV
jgi:hypothetical protein